MSKKSFTTKVDIAVPHTGEADHVLHTKAQNLASSAGDLKEGLTSLVAALCLPMPDDTGAIGKLLAATAGEKKDKKVYAHAVKTAQAAYDKIQVEKSVVWRKIHTALDNATRVLHQSTCVKTPEVTPDMHDPIDNNDESFTDPHGKHEGKEKQTIGAGDVGTLEDALFKK